ncbi:hypothetical protein TUM4442_13500 [Shewanella algae]|nr:hypothetical protein TUM4442_13500 [Shewanella algae]
MIVYRKKKVNALAKFVFPALFIPTIQFISDMSFIEMLLKESTFSILIDLTAMSNLGVWLNSRLIVSAVVQVINSLRLEIVSLVHLIALLQ